MDSSSVAQRLQSPLPPAVAPTTAERRRPLARDVFVDVVRAFATVCVVLGHWLMPEAHWDGESLWIGNALRHGYAWALTWVLQPLALLFFAAGAAASYQQGADRTGRSRGFLRARISTVVIPVAVFVGVWVVAVAGLLLMGVPDDGVWQMARMAPQPLWFLVVWVVLLALAPALRCVWLRWRWRAMIVAVALPLLVDTLRFTAGIEAIAWSNLILVWTVPFLAGIAYATDRLTGRRPHIAAPRLLVTGGIVGSAAMAILTLAGPYPLSMIGMPGEPISNLGPPTAPIVAQALAQVCVVLLARPALVRWAARRRPRAVVNTLARRSMTVYLWHLTAMFAVIGIALLGAGMSLPEPWSASWWLSRPLWLGAFALVLTVLVRTFGRFDGRRRQLPS